MITLITGVPGSGKTLCLISQLMRRTDLKGRPLYLDGIADVNNDIIPHEPVPENESMQTWYNWAPVGAILVIDEAQRVFRPMPSGSKIPEYIAQLETHRHKGLDIFILTQHPRLIHSNVRSLIGNHKHISKTQMGVRRIVEWQRCANPEARSDIREGLVSIYRLDKKAYGVYKSAEEHTKIKTSRSKWVYILPMVFLFLGYSIYSSINFVSDWLSPQAHEVVTEVQQQTQQPVTNNQTTAPPTPTSNASASEPKDLYNPDQFVPVVDGQDWTAPAYNNMNQAIKAMPYPVACVKNGSKCSCYTSQATVLKNFPKKQCLDFVENGIYNPYKDLPIAANSAIVAPVVAN